MDEVVHVNDHLVNSLAKNKNKLRSLSASSRRSNNTNSNIYYTNDLKKDTFISYDNSLRRDYSQLAN